MNNLNARSWVNSRSFYILEQAFFYGSLYCTVLSFSTFILAFNGLVTVDNFSTVNLFYWPTVLMYSSLRKTRHAKHPDTVRSRPTELILLLWMLVGLVGMTITIVVRRDMFPLMQEFGILFLILLGILLGGKAVENIVGAILSPKK